MSLANVVMRGAQYVFCAGGVLSAGSAIYEATQLELIQSGFYSLIALSLTGTSLDFRDSANNSSSASSPPSLEPIDIEAVRNDSFAERIRMYPQYTDSLTEIRDSR
jgi:hypothetical protein